MTNIQSFHSGTYAVVVTSAFGAESSAPAMLNVIPAVEQKLVPGINLMGAGRKHFVCRMHGHPCPAPTWLPLASSPQYYFDLSAPVPPQRLYRSWQSAPASVIATLELHLVPAITLSGSVGSHLRVDGVNQFGPIDAWYTVATETLTNPSQLYFAVSAVGQPLRLDRLVPMP